MKIDFGVDECAAPWSPVSSSTLSATAPEYQASSTLPKVKSRRETQRQSSAGRSVSNRFDLLTLDSDTDSDEESDDPDF